jgi:hypothetical protein
MRWTEDQLQAHLARRGVAGAANLVDVSKPPFALPAATAELPKADLNKTEQAYADTLEMMKQGGSIKWYRAKPMRLILAERTTYEPDFGVVADDGCFEIHEVKGFWRDDARVKIKIAASIFPFRFFAVTKRKGGGWDYEAFA